MDTSGHTSLCEDYVSFETAKLLKEKGFNHWCYKSYGDAVYHKGVPISYDEECDLKSEGLEDEIEYVEGGCLYDFGCDNRKKDAKVWAAPTLWVAMKWLRKVHEIFIRPNINFLYPIRYYCEIFCYGDNLKTQQDVTTESFESPEEACEAAIKYCLKDLI